MFIKSLTVDAGSFTFASSVVDIDCITYVVKAEYRHFSTLFKVIGEIEEEEFATLEQALAHQQELVSYAKENAKNSTKVVRQHLEKCWLQDGKRELTLNYIKQTVKFVRKEANDEEEIYIRTYSFKEYMVVETINGWDMSTSIYLEGIKVHSDGWCFEGGWPSIEDAIYLWLTK